jgi:hypothetical protein
MAGLVWGLCGVGLLISSTEVEAQSREGLLGGLAVLGASVSWAAGSIYARGAPLPRSPLLAPAYGDNCGRPSAVDHGGDGRSGRATPSLRIFSEVHLGSRLPDRVWCIDPPSRRTSGSSA